MIDMKISELQLNVGKSRELVIRPELHGEMGLRPSDIVYLAYLTNDGQKTGTICNRRHPS